MAGPAGRGCIHQGHARAASRVVIGQLEPLHLDRSLWSPCLLGQRPGAILQPCAQPLAMRQRVDQLLYSLGIAPVKVQRTPIIPIQHAILHPELLEAADSLDTEALRALVLPGEQLPAEVYLATQLGISRPTLREALLSLEREGFVVRKHGVGTFVTPGYGRRLESGLECLESVLEMDGKAFTREIGEVYRVYEETVRKAAYNVTAAGWQTTTREAAKTFLRDIVATCNFDEIFALNGTKLEENKRAIHKIEEAVKKKLAKAAVDWGVKIRTVDVSGIEMPPEVKEQVLARWEAEIQKEITVKLAEGAKEALIQRGMGQAEALARVERVKTRTIDEMIEQLRKIVNIIEVQQDATTAHRFIEAIEQISSRIVTEDIVALRYIEALEMIARSEGAKIIFLGEERRFLGPGYENRGEAKQ